MLSLSPWNPTYASTCSWIMPTTGGPSMFSTPKHAAAKLGLKTLALLNGCPRGSRHQLCRNQGRTWSMQPGKARTHQFDRLDKNRIRLVGKNVSEFNEDSRDAAYIICCTPTNRWFSLIWTARIKWTKHLMRSTLCFWTTGILHKRCYGNRLGVDKQPID